MAAILNLRQNLRWPRSIFQIVWSKVHESTEKTLTGKKGSFYLARPLLNVRGLRRLPLFSIDGAPRLPRPF